MFCDKCGNIIEPGNNFCRICGAQVSANKAPLANIGYSAKINDPVFNNYKSKSKAWSFIFAFILAMIAVAGFPIYGNISGEIEFPQSLYYGIGIGGMFVLIAVIQTIKRGFDKTWDGIVTQKKVFKRQVRDNNSSITRHETVYVIKIKKNNGGTKKHNFVNLSGVYDYYNEGDRVRHHKGFEYYEKYDKSQDKVIMCAACLTFNDISNELCTRCKCPLLK